jgi:hypothetical protein
MAGIGTKAEDLSGRVFGRWVVLSRSGTTLTQRALWLCRCECGTEKSVIGAYLRSGRSRSCGCLRKEPYARKHGHASKMTHVYRAWKQMKSRCDNPNMQNFRYYGGRGITYDSRWSEFKNFYADVGDPPEGYWLDRIDNDKGYSKENCRWADPKTQRHNRSDPVTWVDINGERLVLTDAIKKYGKVSYSGTLVRIGRGWTPLQALLTPKGDRPSGVGK